jgi:hypothetical protein
MHKGMCSCLLLGIDPISNGSALHENDRMMTVFSSDGGRETGDESGLGPADDLLETGRGEMVAFVHDEMSIISDQIVSGAFSRQALY